MALLQLDDLSIVFHVRRFRRLPLKELIVRQMFRKSRNPVQEVRALEGINLRFNNGDRIGIIGHNGAGKSTLLKTIAGVYPPTSGRRLVEGRISSLFDISLGFEMDSNGWQNIAYRGFLQGETPKTVREKAAEIATFSELGEFLDLPVRHYSSGMMVRLAFSIATAVSPDILLIDEALTAGDMAFQQKARQRIEQMVERANIVVMVSHDMGSLAALCDRIIWLDHGHIRQIGAAKDVIAAYTAHATGAHAQAA